MDTACDNYSWNGSNYTATGQYNFFTTNSIGCDSTATLDLTIIQTPQTSAGPDVNSCNLNATLNANTAIGIGTWTCSDPNVVIDYANDARVQLQLQTTEHTHSTGLMITIMAVQVWIPWWLISMNNQ